MADDKKAAEEPVTQNLDVSFEGFHGHPGQEFNLRGTGFGTQMGSIIVGDVTVVPTAWTNHCIKGRLPSHVKSVKTGKLISHEGTILMAWDTRTPKDKV